MALSDYDAERLWAGAIGALLAIIVGGSVLFRDLVYGNFVWQYFWGPVYADAHGAACAVWNDGAPEVVSASAECSVASGPVAYPGYTAVSEVGYAITLLLSLMGVVFLLRRLDVGDRTRFLYPMVPFVFLGGALRVVEDANDAVPAGVEATIQYPWNTLIISPLIYFTVFAITLAALVGAVWARNAGYTENYDRPFAGVGTVLLVGTLAYLVFLSATRGYVEFHPIFTVLTLVLATIIAVVLWWLIREHVPVIARGTPVIGAVILWAHSVDGVSNVLGIDWGAELGLAADLVPKHPVNRGIIALTDSVVPESTTAVIGSAWGFLLVKVIAATVVIALFDDEMLEESPRFSVLLLLAVIAVGLGPGTRDMLRATFGI